MARESLYGTVGFGLERSLRPRQGPLSPTSSTVGIVTVTCMDQPHEELIAMADAMDELFERARQPDVQEPLERLENAANEVGKSFSGSWLGYHANVYYKELQPPPPEAYFSLRHGLRPRVRSQTTGEWMRFDPDRVEAAIYARASDPDLTPAERLRGEAVREFDTWKLNVLSLIHSAGSSDAFLARIASDVDEVRILYSPEVIAAMRPSGQLVSLDTVASGQGPWTPPHATVLARVQSVWHAVGAVSRLGELARHAGSHLERLQRQPRRSQPLGTHVFIGHGGSPDWRELKDFLQDRLHLTVDEFNRVPVAGVPNTERLKEMMDAAAIAFLVLTGEDEQADGQLHARMNVIHEVGLFQGRLGFRRAIVILEKGCEAFSNIDGLGQIRFAKANIKGAFEEIRAVLEREGLVDEVVPT